MILPINESITGILKHIIRLVKNQCIVRGFFKKNEAM